MSEQCLNQAKSKGGSPFEYMWAVKVLSVPCLWSSANTVSSLGKKTNRGTASPILRVHSASAALTDSSVHAADLYWIVSLKEQCQLLEDLQRGGIKPHIQYERGAGRNVMKISWVKQWRWQRCICPFKYLHFFPPYHFKISPLYFSHIAVAAELMKLWFKQVPHALLSRLWFEGSSFSWLNMLWLTKNSAEQMVIMASESWWRMTDIWCIRGWQKKKTDLPGSCPADNVAAYSIYRFAIAPFRHLWANKKSCIQPFLSWANSFK